MWNGMTVLAADEAWPCSPNELVIGPGLPQKLSMNCVHPPLPSCVCVATPLMDLTPPPHELAPKPILYSKRNQQTITIEKPANIMAMTLTAHFFCTSDAYS